MLQTMLLKKQRDDDVLIKKHEFCFTLCTYTNQKQRESNLRETCWTMEDNDSE